MTTYNAKDLIEQAAMLADLQNSDFISWKENMMFLDNAWANLYQQIINHGDKTFIKPFTFTGNRVELPDDFYQLNYVCYSSGFNRIPINRKAKTASSNGPFYDLIGNELVIYNKLNSMQTIEVDYFPVRDSLTFSADEQSIQPFNENITDVCNSKVLSGGQVIDIFSRESETSEPTYGFMLCESGVINDSSKPYFKKDNRAYYVEQTGNYLEIYKSNGQSFKTIEADVFPIFPTERINGMTDYGLYWIEAGTLWYWDFETKITTAFATGFNHGRFNKVYGFNNSVYYENNEGIWCDNELLINASDYDTFNGVLKVDLKTGYGILVDNKVIKSVFPNTELDYPNNFYFNYMAYQLAVYYKIKQNQDPSGLVALAGEALRTFYDSLPKDENEYVRIANVYAR